MSGHELQKICNLPGFLIELGIVWGFLVTLSIVRNFAVSKFIHNIFGDYECVMEGCFGRFYAKIHKK